MQLPGLPASVAPPSRSQTVSLNILKLAPGDTLNDTEYQATLTKIASNASAGSSGNTILVEVRAVRLPEGEVKSTLIGVNLQSPLS
jgi:hypothetical protein